MEESTINKLLNKDMITTINEYKLNETLSNNESSNIITIPKELCVNLVMIFINKDTHLSPKVKEILQNQLNNFTIHDVDDNDKLKDVLMNLNDEALVSMLSILEKQYKKY